MYRPLIGVFALGCSAGSPSQELDDVAAGHADICFDSSVAASPQPPDCAPLPEGRDHELSGTLIGTISGSAQARDLGCGEDAIVLQLDDGGVVWTIGYQVTDAQGSDITPDLPAAVGDPLLVHFIEDNHGEEDALYLNDRDGGLLLAIDEESWGMADKLGGLSVEAGDEDGARAKTGNGCEVQPRKLVFTGDEAVQLGVGDTSEVSLPDRSVRVQVLGAWDLADDGCDDKDVRAFVAWRG